MSKPLLILGDSPTSYTGLGRIARDIGNFIFSGLSGDFRVATFGYGEVGSRELPYMNYGMNSVKDYIAADLPRVWKDFAGKEKGIVLAIWNPSWLSWLVNPENLPQSNLRRFLEDKPFDIWGYIPVDGACSNGTAPSAILDTIRRLDRSLAYTKYGSIATGIENYLPHGIHTDIFYPRDRSEARRTFIKRVLPEGPDCPLREDIFLVGVVATNSPRKDWHLAIEACSAMNKMGKTVAIWAHTDAEKKNWDIRGMAQQFGVLDRLVLTTNFMSDEDMAWAYSACDVTLGIGSGEGWGYPLAESLACGVPVIHGRYAGGAEFVPDECLVTPAAFRGEGYYGIERPVFNAYEWACRALEMHGKKVELPPYIAWENAWPKWREWLLEGIE